MKKLIALLLAVLFIFGSCVNAFAGIVSEKVKTTKIEQTEHSRQVYSGTCGENLTWTLDTETGVLEIIGNGYMTNWDSTLFAPWYSHRSSIKTIVIGNSVTSIGSWAFYDCISLSSVNIGSSVKVISIDAFKSCVFLASVTIPDSVKSIGAAAFDYCIRLVSVTIPDSVTSIDDSAFHKCWSLASVTLPNSVTSIGDSAFCECLSLTSAVFLGAPPSSFGCGVFDNSASDFCLYYTSAHASEWAPNGETTWNGYPIALYSGTDDPVDPSYTVTTPYMLSPGDDPSGEFHVEFNDSWFSTPSSVFNYKLAKASLAAACGSFSRDNNPNADYVIQTLKAFKFNENSIITVKFNDNTSTEDTNTCGYAFAYKELSNGNYLVAAAIRSSGYGSEWESNFTIMPDENSCAYGFKKASDIVYADLNDYIVTNLTSKGISANNIRVWTFGFSRGAAISNLLAARMNQESGIPQSQIFAYTFATPLTVLKSAQEKHNNIFNILQETDVVPRLPLKNWDYSWYGINYYLPSRTKTGKSFKDKRNEMEISFNRIMEESGRPDVKYLLGNTQELSIDLLIDYLDDIIRTRSIYYDFGWQEIMRSAGIKMGNSGGFDFMTLLGLLLPNNVVLEHIYSLFDTWDSLSYLEKTSNLAQLVIEMNSQECITQGGQTVWMLSRIFANYLLRLTADLDPFDSNTYTDNYNNLFYMLKDAIINGKSGELFMQHWPETYMAWLNSASDESLFERSSYKRVSLKCPIDVYVYDGNNNLVGRIVDDIVDDSIEESVYCACDMLGEKTVFLPDDDTYRIEIVAREDCDVDIINEYYTEESELVSVECFIEVAMTEEQELEAGYEQDEQECTLISSGTEIQPDQVIEEGEAIPEYTVELTSEGFGAVSGNGYYTLGETVTLCAMEYYGSAFNGWYDENGALISTETAYSYSITEDGAFTAVFEGGARPGDINGDSNVNNLDALLALRYSLGLISLSEEQVAHGDVNGDGLLNTHDALTILRYTMGLTTL